MGMINPLHSPLTQTLMYFHKYPGLTTIDQTAIDCSCLLSVLAVSIISLSISETNKYNR